MSQSSTDSKFYLFLIIGILLCAGYIAIFRKQIPSIVPPTTNTNTNASVQNTNTSNTEDYQNSGGNGTTNTNQTAYTNSNTAVVTNSSTNATIQPILTIAEAIEQAEEKNGTQVCVRGYYQSSFEFSAMSAQVQEQNGIQRLVQPLVWIDTVIPESAVSCTTTVSGQQTCLGELTTCGIFRAAGDGEIGFGHLSQYRYQLSR